MVATVPLAVAMDAGFLKYDRQPLAVPVAVLWPRMLNTRGVRE